MRMFKWIKPFSGWMILSCIIMLAASAISLLSPYLIRMAIDQAIPAQDYKKLIILSAILLISTLVVRILLAEKLKIMTRVAQKIIVNIFEYKKIHFKYF